MNHIFKTVGVFLLLLGFGVLLNAQTSNGTLVGTITDPSGAAVVGAKIDIVDAQTGATRTTDTIANGSYRFDFILPGTYSITVTAPGFEKSYVQAVDVPATVITTSNVKLKVGSTKEEVEVRADATLLNTDNAQLSGTFSEQEIGTLPLNSLSAYSLALTLPGVTSAEQGGFSNGVNFAVGGGRPRANNFLIEGQDNNDAGIMGQGLQPENVEAQKEIIVIENNYTAEYGHGAGSVSNLIFKSGTNQFHGSIFERGLNSSLDSTDHYDVRNDIPKGLYRENIYGFTVGGPIVHNKLFAFGSYQWDAYRSTANLATLLVPTTNGFATLNSLPTNTRISNLIEAYGGLVGDLTELQKIGGVTSIPLGIDPNTNLDRGSVEVGATQRRLPDKSDSPELDLKGDYVINPNDTLNLRYIRTSYLTPYDTGNFPGQLPGFDTDQDGTAHNAGIVETHIFNQHLVNEFRLSYGRIGFNFGLPSSTTSNPLFGTPNTSITNLTGFGIPTSMPQGRFHNTYQLQDTISWTLKKHFLKIGFDVADIRVRDQIPFNFYGSLGYASVSGGYTGLANYIDDFGGSNSTLSINYGSPIARPQLVSQNYFVQDTWKLLKNLSLDLGFRYEYNGAPFNANGTPYPGIDLSDPACFPSSSVTCNTAETPDYGNWAPRVGFAYTPKYFSRYSTTIRAGFGTFYDVLFTNIIDNIQASAPNAASPQLTSLVSGASPRGTANWSQQFSTLSKTPTPYNTAEPIVDHLLRPKTYHWNLSVQQELPAGFILQTSYVGERGEHLFGTTEFNPYLDDWYSGDRRINSRGRIVLRDNSGDSEYHGLWAELDRKVGRQFDFRASYTFQRALDDVSEIFTTNNESTYASGEYPTPRKQTDWGLSAYDHRQRLVLTYVWAPKEWHAQGFNKVAAAVVNDWTIAGVTQFQSGTPMNVEVGYEVNGDGITNDRPYVSNPKAPLATYAFDSWWWGDTPGAYFCSGPSLWYTNNPCEVVTTSDVHWIVPPGGTRPANTVGRNNLISPGYSDWDMNIQRSFKLSDRFSFDVRGEFFNIFNHGNAGIENSTLISGILTDNWSSAGTNSFANPLPTVSGYRHARIFLRITF